MGKSSKVDTGESEKKQDSGVEKALLENASAMDIKMDDFKIDLKLGDQNSSIDKGEQNEIIEEMAEDMLHLIEKSTRLENSMAQMQAVLSQMQADQGRYHKEMMVETRQVKKELLSERKALIARSTFNAVLPAIESLELNCRALKASPDKVLVNQMTVVIDMLKNIIQSLGYHSFEAKPGDAFDPASMECIGYEQGETGIVIRVERMGYRTDGALIKPCGIILGQQKKDEKNK